jgi:hypothetical protein
MIFGQRRSLERGFSPISFDQGESAFLFSPSFFQNLPKEMASDSLKASLHLIVINA